MQNNLSGFVQKLSGFNAGVRLLAAYSDGNSNIKIHEVTGKVHISIDKPVDNKFIKSLKGYGFIYCETDKEWIY